MVVQAYILIQTDVGKAADVAAEIARIKGVTLAEDVTGPYDVIVRAAARPSQDAHQDGERDHERHEDGRRDQGDPAERVGRTGVLAQRAALRC